MAKSTQQSTSQYETALRELRSLILAGEFEANSRLAETAVAKLIGVSRTPLRQAMARLVEERLLERVESGGCRVVSFTIDDVVDAIEIRGVLEGTAARLSAERGITAEYAKQCQEVLDELDDAVFRTGDVAFELYVPLNAQFHELLSEMSGSRTIQQEVLRVQSLPLASPSAFVAGQKFLPDFEDSLRTAQRQHRNLVQAIVNREGARAEAIAREHARLALANLDLVASRTNLIDRIPGLSLVSELAP